MESQIFSDEIKYTISNNNHSSIQFRNVSPQATNTVTLSKSSASGPTEFIISPAVVNLSLSRLEFTIEFTAFAANATWINANFHTIISRLVVYDSGTNALWADISNFEKYASLTVPLSTQQTELFSKAGGLGTLVIPTTSAIAKTNPYEDITKNSGITVNLDGSGSNLYAANPMFGRQQTLTAVINTAGFIDVSIPFSSLKSTVLGLNKLIYSPTNLVVQIYWNASNNFAWHSLSDTVPTSTPISLNTAPTISALNLALACESNLGLISQVITKATGEGIEFPIPYPSVIRTNIASAASQSFSLQLTRAYGNRILYILSSPFNAGATVNLSNEHGCVIDLYNTFLNNVSIKSPSGFDVTKGEDYMIGNKEYLKKSVIQNLAEYRLGEWVHVDSWVGEKSISDVDYTQIDGLDVGSASSTFQIQATVNPVAAYNWITVIVGQKMLKITSMGSQVM